MESSFPLEREAYIVVSLFFSAYYDSRISLYTYIHEK